MNRRKYSASASDRLPVRYLYLDLDVLLIEIP